MYLNNFTKFVNRSGQVRVQAGFLLKPEPDPDPLRVFFFFLKPKPDPILYRTG